MLIDLLESSKVIGLCPNQEGNFETSFEWKRYPVLFTDWQWKELNI